MASASVEYDWLWVSVKEVLALGAVGADPPAQAMAEPVLAGQDMPDPGKAVGFLALYPGQQGGGGGDMRHLVQLQF